MNLLDKPPQYFEMLKNILGMGIATKMEQERTKQWVEKLEQEKEALTVEIRELKKDLTPPNYMVVRASSPTIGRGTVICTNAQELFEVAQKELARGCIVVIERLHEFKEKAIREGTSPPNVVTGCTIAVTDSSPVQMVREGCLVHVGWAPNCKYCKANKVAIEKGDVDIILSPQSGCWFHPEGIDQACQMCQSIVLSREGA